MTIMPYSTKMQTATFRWYLNIILAGLIFVNAEAGRLLGIQSLPLNFSAVWPATGFSLTALLLFGYRAWPGIFAGNFIYNMLHLSSEHHTILGPFICAIAISSGSLVQALVGTYFMRKYSSTSYFRTVKDVMIFLLAGGFITCITAATIGVTTLYLYGVLPPEQIPYSWLTFWLGDVMGVYVCTPLLIVWCLRLPTKPSKEVVAEVGAMIASCIFISALFFSVTSYPSIYLYIPFCLWVGYRLGFHAATVMVLLISIITITSTSLGQGWFVYRYPETGLLIAVMFLEVLVFTTLFAAGCHQELNQKN